MANSTAGSPDKVSLSADIVAAYVSRNSVTPSGLPALIESIHLALTNLGAVEAVPEAEALVPAVPIRKSITPGFLICLDDGKKFKSLKRHLVPWNDTRPVPGEMESPEGLSDGGTRLRCHPICPREKNRPWPAAQGHRETETGTDIQGGGREGCNEGQRCIVEPIAVLAHLEAMKGHSHIRGSIRMIAQRTLRVGAMSTSSEPELDEAQIRFQEAHGGRLYRQGKPRAVLEVKSPNIPTAIYEFV